MSILRSRKFLIQGCFGIAVRDNYMLLSPVWLMDVYLAACGMIQGTSTVVLLGLSI